MTTQLLDGASQADLVGSSLYVTPEAPPLAPFDPLLLPDWDDWLLGTTGAGVSVPVPVLAIGSIARIPVVAGMLLGDSSAEITADLFRYPDLDDGDRVASLTLALGKTWAEVLSDVGSGAITLLLDDTALDSFVEDGDDIIVFSYRGQRAFAMLVEAKDEVTVADSDDGEEKDQRVTYTGRGYMAVLARALVYPTGGVGLKPIEQDRLFNWASPEFDNSAWGPVAYLGTITDKINVATFLLALAGFPTDPALVTVNVPQYDLGLFWAPGGSGLVDQPPGDIYVHDTLTVSIDGTYILYFYCDDNGELYINGSQVASVEGVNWMGVAQVPVTLTAGTYRVALHLNNSDAIEPSNINGANYGWAVYAENTILGQSSAGELVDQAKSTAVCVAYPSAPPGMTVGKVMIIALEEAQARGEIAAVTWNFTEFADSAGVPWPVVPDIATKTGTDMLTFFRELAATYVDLWMDPASFTLHAWNIDGRGADKSATIAIQAPTDPDDPTTGNIRAYRKTGEFQPVGAFLLYSRFGWSERTNAASIAAYGRRTALLEIGAPTSVAELNRMADGQFSYFADPRTEANATIMPMSNADAPYWSYTVGDELDTPDGTLRLLGLAMEEDENTGLGIPTLTFGSIILGAQERVFQALNKLR